MQAGTIPNLFEIAKNVKFNDSISTIETISAHDIKTGDLVKLILELGKEIEKIITVKNSHKFTFNQPVTSRVFIYGKKVNGLHTVDYDAITTLNISAMQALLARIESLEKENLELKTDLQSRINAIIKKMNSKSQKNEFSKVVY